MKSSLPLAFLIALSACATAGLPPNAEGQLKVVDEQQRAMVARGDVVGLTGLAHSDLAINAPGGHILTRDQFLTNMRNGEIRAEQFSRTPEYVRISGNVAVVMGRETFTPAATSELGRLYGVKPLNRRYVNIYVWQGGRWRWLARQANVIAK
jgi:hypothetical protein